MDIIRGWNPHTKQYCLQVKAAQKPDIVLNYKSEKEMNEQYAELYRQYAETKKGVAQEGRVTDK